MHLIYLSHLLIKFKFLHIHLNNGQWHKHLSGLCYLFIFLLYTSSHLVKAHTHVQKHVYRHTKSYYLLFLLDFQTKYSALSVSHQLFYYKYLLLSEVHLTFNPYILYKQVKENVKINSIKCV